MTVTRSGAVKRLMAELKELQANPAPDLTATPLEDNMLEWHFTIRGPTEGGFASGRYHGRISFPTDYPFKPPNISFLTPNGRFEVGKKICLSITGHHPEFWRPVWGIRTALIALISFLPTSGDGAIGSLDYTEAERSELAKKSREWICRICGCCNRDVLPDESAVPVEKAVPEEGLTFSTNTEAVGETKSNGDSVNFPKIESTITNDILPQKPTLSVNNSHSDVDGNSTPLESTQQSLSTTQRVQQQKQATIPQRIPSSRLPSSRVRLQPGQAVIEQDPTIIRRKRQIDTALLFVVFMIFCLVMRKLAPYSSYHDEM